jgi:3-deoxy-D-manno-octulosonic-acid transferase
VRYVLDAAYLLVLTIVGPFYWVRRKLKGKPSAPLRKRLFEFPKLPPKTSPRAWIHAVSVGESAAASPLLLRLRESRPDLDVVFTSTTVAGLKTAERSYRDVVVAPSPLDFSFAVERFLDAVAPDVVVLMELELWPNLLRACEKRGIPVLVANARVSRRSFRRYRALARVWPGFLRPIALFLAQDETHKERISGLGVPRSRVVVAGNLKFDAAPTDDGLAHRTEWRRTLGFSEDDKVFVAGSTHPGEDAIVVRAFLRVREAFPRARLVLAPRHLERVPEVTRLLAELHCPAFLRSAPPPPGGASCVVLDTTGELGRLYAAADVAFVGGSLVPIGGHNLLEPAAYGVPMCTGPFVETVAETARLFVEAGSLVETKDEAAMAALVVERFAAPEDARRRGDAARRLIESRRGAAARCAEATLSSLRRESAPERSRDG